MTNRADLRRVCFHELGHLVCAAHFGIDGQISIDLERTGISGKFHFFLSTVPRVNTVIALGGGAAQALIEPHAWSSHSQLLEAARSRLSAEDIAIAGPFRRSDIETSLHLCRVHWEQLAHLASIEISSLICRGAVVARLAACT